VQLGRPGTVEACCARRAAASACGASGSTVNGTVIVLDGQQLSRTGPAQPPRPYGPRWRAGSTKNALGQLAPETSGRKAKSSTPWQRRTPPPNTHAAAALRGLADPILHGRKHPPNSTSQWRMAARGAPVITRAGNRARLTNSGKPAVRSRSPGAGRRSGGSTPGPEDPEPPMMLLAGG
jgi:hypothetical protein